MIDDVEQTTGNWTHTKKCRSLVPGFCWYRSYWDRADEANAYRLPSMGRPLLTDARQSSLLAQFVEKRFFFQRAAGPQQLEEGVLRVGCGAAGMARVLA